MKYDYTQTIYEENILEYLISGSLGAHTNNKFEEMSEMINRNKTSDTLLGIVDSSLVWINANLDYSNETYPLDIDTCLKEHRGGNPTRTNLFLAYMKSINVPSRFVLGINTKNNSYTSWAQIYIKDMGWMDIDVTNRIYEKPSNSILINYGNDFADDINFFEGSSLHCIRLKNE